MGLSMSFTCYLPGFVSGWAYALGVVGREGVGVVGEGRGEFLRGGR